MCIRDSLSPRCLSWKEPGAETGARTAAWVGQSAATLRPRDRDQQRGAACLQPWLIEASGFVSSLSMFAFPSSSAPPMTLCPARHLFSKFNFTILPAQLTQYYLSFMLTRPPPHKSSTRLALWAAITVSLTVFPGLYLTSPRLFL